MLDETIIDKSKTVKEHLNTRKIQVFAECSKCGKINELYLERGEKTPEHTFWGAQETLQDPLKKLKLKCPGRRQDDGNWHSCGETKIKFLGNQMK